MSEKVAKRLRRHEMQAQHFFIALRSRELGWIGGKSRLAYPSNDGLTIYQLGKNILQQYWQGEPVAQIQVTALDPKPQAQQLDFFMKFDPQQELLNQTIDAVNQRFGEFKLAKARLLNRSDMPNVIAPAWKPDGHRQTIEE